MSSDPCNIENRDVITKRVTTRDEEIWEVAKLKCVIKSNSKPSERLENLKARRHVRHEKVIAEFSKKLQEINENVEKNIRISSMEIKAFMKHYNDQLQEILRTIDIPEVTAYSGSVFLNFQKKADILRAEQINLVSELYEDLNKFEDQRAEKSKLVFQKYAEEIRKVGHMLPYDLESFIELETLQLNQLTLNNRRCYEDLKLTLTLITEQTFKSFVDKIFCIQDKWIEKKVHETCFNMPMQAILNLTSQIPDIYKRLELKGKELAVEMTPFALSETVEVEVWADNVQSVIESLESHGKSIIELYKKALNAVFNGFDQELEEIKKEMIDFESLDIEERIIKPIVFTSQKVQLKDVDELEIFWQQSLENIRTQLLDVTEFLLEAGKLWDSHSERIWESKCIILKVLEKNESDCGGTLLELETQLNLALDALRQEHVLSKLDKAYEDVVAILDSIKEKHELLYLEDVRTVEDYFKMVDLEASVLATELEEFVNITYPMGPIKNHSSAEHLQGISQETPLAKQIYKCVQAINSIRYWKRGVWSALESFAKKPKETLIGKAEIWVEKKIEVLAEKKTVQLGLIHKKYERIKVEIYEKRKVEIEYHQELLKQHKQGIKALSRNMFQELETLGRKLEAELNETKGKFEEIERNAKTENRAAIIRGAQLWLERKRQDVETKIKNSFEKLKAQIDIKISDAKQANISFMKDIRLFHEGGNFSAEEGKELAEQLEGVDKELGRTLTNLTKSAQNLETELIKENALMFTPTIKVLTSLHEELIFEHAVEGRLTDLVKKIQEAAGTMNSDFDILKNQVECLMGDVDGTELLNLEKECSKWDITLKMLYKNVCNIFYPLKFPDVFEIKPEEEIEESDETKKKKLKSNFCATVGKLSGISLTSKFAKIKAEEIFDCKDYRKQLFDSDGPPEKDETFMAIISNKLWLEMDRLQRMACPFYKQNKDSDIIRTDLLPRNYDQFAELILSKFQYYNIQCEQLWLQKIGDFLPVLGKLKESTNKVFQRLLNEYEETAESALSAYKEDFLTCLYEQTDVNSRSFRFLENKLLPLHGNPKNKNLLDALEEEVVKTTAAMGVSWTTLVKTFLDQVKCFRITHLKNKDRLKKIEEEYKKICKNLFIEKLGSDILNFISKKVENGGYHMKKIRKKSTIEQSKTKNPFEEKKFNLKFCLENVHSVNNLLSQLKEIVEYEQMYRNPDTLKSYRNSEPHSEESFSRFIVPELNLLAEPLEMDKMINKIIKKLNKQSIDMKALAETKAPLYKEYLYKWLEVWKGNVKTIYNLFTVRYKERPKATKEVEKEKSDTIQNSKLPQICI